VALGITTHEVTQAEIEKGSLPTPQFNTPAVAYVLAANLDKGDVVDIELVNGDTSLMRNSQTVAEHKATVLLQAGEPRGARRAAGRRAPIMRRSRSRVKARPYWSRARSRSS